MSGRKRSILFIGHDAGYTGAPIILSMLVEWMSRNSDFETHVLLKADGPLRPVYEAASKTCTCFSSEPAQPGNRYLQRLLMLLNGQRKLSERQLKAIYPPGSIDVIFSNTITNGEVLSALSYLDCPVLCRVAELEHWIRRAGRRNLDRVRRSTDRYIAVSQAVRMNLIERHGIPQERIEVIHGFVRQPADVTPALRRTLDLPREALIVGGCGDEWWRKGKDLFLLVAIEVLGNWTGLPLHFVWLGGRSETEEARRFQRDVENAELEGRVHSIPTVSNPLDYITDFDVFLMTSREDPYPIASLEAASLGKPIICFADAGGTPEFVEGDAGFVVPYLDVAAMAEKVGRLAGDAKLRTSMGARAKEKVLARHHWLADHTTTRGWTSQSIWEVPGTRSFSGMTS